MGSIGRYIRQIYRIWGTYSQRALKDTNLSISEIEALKIITYHKDISQQGLSCHLGIDKGAVARLVASLEEKEYISRITDENDKRIKRLCTTQSANEIRAELKALEDEFYSYLIEGLSMEERATFISLLERMAQTAKDERHNGFKNISELN